MYRVLVVLLLIGAVAGCDSPSAVRDVVDDLQTEKPQIDDPQGPETPDDPPAVITDDAEPLSVSVIGPTVISPEDETFTWQVSWEGGEAPYLVMLFPGGSLEPVSRITESSPMEIVLPVGELIEPGLYDYTVIVRGSAGLADSAGGTFRVQVLPSPGPVISNVVVDGSVVTVYAASHDGSAVEITVEDTQRLVPDQWNRSTDASGEAVFVFTTGMPFGAVESVDFTATVSRGRTDSASATVYIDPPPGGILQLDYDRLYRLLVLNLDCSSVKEGSIEFSLPDWIVVNGTDFAGRIEFSRGWTERGFLVEFLDSEVNTAEITVTVHTEFDAPHPGVGRNSGSAAIVVTRPICFERLEYDYFDPAVRLDLNSATYSGLRFDLVFPDGVAGEPANDIEIEGHYRWDVVFYPGGDLHGYVKVSVTDPIGNNCSSQVWIQHPLVKYVPDRIYAVFDQETAAVGEPVLVTVSTGELSYPFQYMTGVGLVINEDAEFVPGSYNAGSPGGARDAADGVWELVTTDGEFLLPPDSIITSGPDPDESIPVGFSRWDFNVTPMGGKDVEHIKGDLFNCEFTFSEPGLKILSFEKYNGVNRTYYSDWQTGTDRFWEDCSNWHPGLQTTLEVQ